MPTAATAATRRTNETVRQRDLMSLTLEVNETQANDAAASLAKHAGLPQILDGFFRGCAVHLARRVLKLALARDDANQDLARQLMDASNGVRTSKGASWLPAELGRHDNNRIRDWSTWAARPVILHMIFPQVYFRLDSSLLTTVPAITNAQEATYCSNLAKSPTGTLSR